jgi:hypothetical protein
VIRAAVLTLVVSARLATASSAATIGHFADPAGDAQASCPDITSVTVASTDAGTISFRACARSGTLTARLRLVDGRTLARTMAVRIRC